MIFSCFQRSLWFCERSLPVTVEANGFRKMEVLLQGSKPHMVPACAVDIVGNIQMLTGVFHGRGRVFLQSYLKQGVPKGTQARESLSPKAAVLQSHCN